MKISSNNLVKKNNYIEYINEKDNFMNLDVGRIVLQEKEIFNIPVDDKEKALDLLNGKVEVIVDNKEKYFFERANLFDDKPSAVLADKFTNIQIKCISKEAELVLQKTKNEKSFGYKVWNKEDIKIQISGENEANGVCVRKVIEFFSYETFKDSNMVMGEVICTPGSWASWPPHRHSQPEMYLFKFNKPLGFGVSFVGDNTIKVMENDAVCIPGNLTHPTVGAPGYIMWYCWMIPNLLNNPWVERSYDKDYEWTKTNDIEVSKMR